MSEDSRPKSDCIAEIKSYNGKMITPERMIDLGILSEELGSDYDVRIWTFGKHLRVSVIYEDKQM